MREGCRAQLEAGRADLEAGRDQLESGRVQILARWLLRAKEPDDFGRRVG
jgi:hypothetical protein